MVARSGGIRPAPGGTAVATADRMDLLSERCELARVWLRSRAHHEPDRVHALAVLEAIESRERPPPDALGWLAAQALDGVLAARIALGVL